MMRSGDRKKVVEEEECKLKSLKKTLEKKTRHEPSRTTEERKKTQTKQKRGKYRYVYRLIVGSRYRL